MRKIILFTQLVCLALAGCQSKQQSSTEQNHRLEMSALTVKKDVQLPTHNSYSFNIHLLKADGNDSIAQQINNQLTSALFDIENLNPQTAIDSFIHVETFFYHNLPMDEKDKDVKPMDAYYTLKSQTQKWLSHTLYYQADVDSYSGGNHGLVETRCFNFRVKDGSLIKLDQLFKGDFETLLAGMLYNALVDEVNKNKKLEPLTDNSVPDKEVMLTDNFILKPESITFVYNPYDVLSYSYGKIEVTLLKKTIQDILTINNDIWN